MGGVKGLWVCAPAKPAQQAHMHTTSAEPAPHCTMTGLLACACAARRACGLCGLQGELVRRVAAAAKVPITVVITGSSLDVSALKANEKVGAILWRGYVKGVQLQSSVGSFLVLSAYLHVRPMRP